VFGFYIICNGFCIFAVFDLILQLIIDVASGNFDYLKIERENKTYPTSLSFPAEGQCQYIPFSSSMTIYCRLKQL